MSWEIFDGSGVAREDATGDPVWRALPDLPPWRTGGESRRRPPALETTPDLIEAVNAALHLRRPLLLTGLPGSGKSTVVDLISQELQLGRTLKWHITSRSSLNDGLYHYDALGRLQAIEARSTLSGFGAREKLAVEDFVTLGPLGSAIASSTMPRALLIDEIDKSDLDLPGDLLNVLEDGYFDIPVLAREAGEATVRVRGADQQSYDVTNGRVSALHFPVIILTSNGERTFPAPFLRRCIRYDMPIPGVELLTRIVMLHLGREAATDEQQTIEAFAEQLRSGQSLAVDQLLNLIYIVSGVAPPASSSRSRLEGLLLRSLSSR